MNIKNKINIIGYIKENLSKKPRMFRQGDVLLIETDNIPEKANIKDKVLAYGEVTGHKHQFLDNPQELVQVFENEGDQFVKVISNDAVLSHEEHKPQTIPQGVYKVITQREYDPIQGYKEEQAKMAEEKRRSIRKVYD